MRLPITAVPALADAVERLPSGDPRWWDAQRVNAFVSSLSLVQTDKLRVLMSSRRSVWATAYLSLIHI